MSYARIRILVLMIEDVKQMLGKLVKRFRETNNLKQADFADQTGYTPRQIRRIESGECSPSMEKAIRLWLLVTGATDDDDTTG